MNKNDYGKFREVWIGANANSANAKQLDNSVINFAFEVLMGYEIADIAKALVIHARKNKFAPTPSEIIEIISPTDATKSHMGPDEAWAIALESFDETATVIMTKQIVEARSVALEIYEAGDLVGARMAFRESYSRLIKDSSIPEWYVSEGFDKAQREDAVRKAVSIGRLSQDTASKYLSAPVNDGGVIGKLLTGKVVDIKSSQLVNIRKIKSVLEEYDRLIEENKAARRIEEAEKRKAFEKAKQRAVNLSGIREMKTEIIEDTKKAVKTSPQKAIRNFCKGCIYDPKAGGTWVEQIEACTVTKCELYEHGPKTKKTRDSERKKIGATIPLPKRDCSCEKNEIAEELRMISYEMGLVAKKMSAYAETLGDDVEAMVYEQHAAELFGAGKMAAQWADSINDNSKS